MVLETPKGKDLAENVQALRVLGALMRKQYTMNAGNRVKGLEGPAKADVPRSNHHAKESR